MRILFFCSCLEPGRDGVGDYVRLLAESCGRQGHRCAIVALNDPFMDVMPTKTDDMETELTCLRLPSSASWKDRVEFVWEFRERFRPDWISFNLVPYAFNRKGILLGRISAFRALTEGTPLHLMLHELYLGAGRPAPLRHHLVGRAQSFAIKRLLARLRPELVTASNPVYAAMLRNLGADARVLPLFGNIPLLDSSALPPIADLLPQSGIAPENRADWWIGLFFGAVHEQWKPEPFLGILMRAADRAGRKICLVLAGRSSRAIWDDLQKTYGSRITFVDVGEQPPATISALLQMADFGVACSPWQLIGKSGTVAAMLDHGLPVIVTRDDFEPYVGADQPPSSDPLVHLCDDALEDKLAAGLSKRAPRGRADEIAAQLCTELSRANSQAP